MKKKQWTNTYVKYNNARQPINYRLLIITKVRVEYKVVGLWYSNGATPPPPPAPQHGTVLLYHKNYIFNLKKVLVYFPQQKDTMYRSKIYLQLVQSQLLSVFKILHLIQNIDQFTFNIQWISVKKSWIDRENSMVVCIAMPHDLWHKYWL